MLTARCFARTALTRTFSLTSL
ncbi:hypothetical protein LCGC14_2111110, partial [marine sediment metagenome]